MEINGVTPSCTYGDDACDRLRGARHADAVQDRIILRLDGNIENLWGWSAGRFTMTQTRQAWHDPPDK